MSDHKNNKNTTEENGLDGIRSDEQENQNVEYEVYWHPSIPTDTSFLNTEEYKELDEMIKTIDPYAEEAEKREIEAVEEMENNGRLRSHLASQTGIAIHEELKEQNRGEFTETALDGGRLRPDGISADGKEILEIKTGQIDIEKVMEKQEQYVEVAREEGYPIEKATLLLEEPGSFRDVFSTMQSFRDAQAGNISTKVSNELEDELTETVESKVLETESIEDESTEMSFEDELTETVESEVLETESIEDKSTEMSFEDELTETVESEVLETESIEDESTEMSFEDELTETVESEILETESIEDESTEMSFEDNFTETESEFVETDSVETEFSESLAEFESSNYESDEGGESESGESEGDEGGESGSA